MLWNILTDYVSGHLKQFILSSFATAQIKLCAIQNIPLTGHRDDGRINPDGTYPPENDGNFRMLLRFRVQSGDSNLQKHLHQAKDNKNMTGPIKRPSSLTNTLLHNITGSVASCYKSHRLSTCLRPLNYVVLFTTITRRFRIRPYFLQTSLQLSSMTSSVSDGPLTQFTAKPSFAMQAIA